MGIILLLVLAMAIFLFGMYWFLNAYTGFWYSRLVRRKAETLDFLLRHGCVPGKWRFRVLERAKQLAPFLRQYYRWRLRRLMPFARSIADGEQRVIYVDCLEHLQKEWAELQLDEMVGL